MPSNVKTPINRSNMFYSEEDFEFETDLVLGYMEEDLNQTVVVYEVDYEKTTVNDIYKEASGKIRYKMPKELPCMFEIKDNQLKSYDSKTSNAVYAINGNLTVIVLNKTLVKYKCDIKRGDYIGVMIDTNRMAYFVVTNDGRLNTSNQNYVGTFKTAYRQIEAAPVTNEEFNGE